jgi:transcriptional regulator with XRE-family HTH domain
MHHRLRTLRTQRGLTLRQISERTGLSVTTLHEIEKHERKVSLMTALKLGHFFDMPVAEIWRPLFQQICEEAPNGRS